MSKVQSGASRAPRPVPSHPSGRPGGRAPTPPTRSSRPHGPDRTAARPEGPASGLARFRRIHPMLAALTPVVLVVAAIGSLVIVKATNHTPGTPSSRPGTGSAAAASNTGTTPLPAGVLTATTSVSSATLAAIGAPRGEVAPLETTPTSSGVLHAADGKPEIVYIGAEFCPFCAAQRWALVVALSRFGIFSGLTATHSSTTDVYPNTQTFSFYGSTYASPTVDFVSVEEQTNQLAGGEYTTLQTPTAKESALLADFDRAPYTTESGSIPFLDIANRYISIGSSYSPQVLAGLSMRAIADQLHDKNSAVAQSIDGAANEIAAAITAVTGVQPNTGTPVPTRAGA